MHDPPAVLVPGLVQESTNGTLAQPLPLELRQNHPADLRDRSVIGVVGPEGDCPGHHLGGGRIGEDHFEPSKVSSRLLGIPAHLGRHLLARLRAAEVGHHDGIAPHLDIGIDIVRRYVPQPHWLLLVFNEDRCTASITRDPERPGYGASGIQPRTAERFAAMTGENWSDYLAAARPHPHQTS